MSMAMVRAAATGNPCTWQCLPKLCSLTLQSLHVLSISVVTFFFEWPGAACLVRWPLCREKESEWDVTVRCHSGTSLSLFEPPFAFCSSVVVVVCSLASANTHTHSRLSSTVMMTKMYTQHTVSTTLADESPPFYLFNVLLPIGKEKKLWLMPSSTLLWVCTVATAVITITS